MTNTSPTSAAVRSKFTRCGERAMLIVLAVVPSTALAAWAVFMVTRTRREMRDLESRVIDALDVLDAEHAATAQAKRIISEARGGKLVSVPAAKWVKNVRDDKRVTGVLVALAIVTSAGVVIEQGKDAEPEQEAAPVLATPIPSTLRPSTPVTRPSTTSTTSTSTSVPIAPTTTTTTTALPDASSSDSALQLGYELQAGVLVEEVFEGHDLADILATHVGDDLPEAEELLDVVDRCLAGDEPSSTQDCPPL